MQDDKQQNQQLNIELNEDVASGIYSNLAIISHTNAEFVVDFIQIMPGVPKAKVKSRIILTPQHAKRLMKALRENVNRFESEFGSITDLEMPPNIFPMGFGGPQGQA
ncbi:MAG TPA: DUF3467 domain-containing protein [Bacteroidia bacterium]|nr:DUF3467 domain-containing protein [Bacteroidia bacterium]